MGIILQKAIVISYGMAEYLIVSTVSEKLKDAFEILENFRNEYEYSYNNNYSKNL